MANSSDNFFSETARLKLEDGKEYRKKLHEEAGRILSSMLDVLPSVYNATVPSTEYAKHLKRVSLELARLKIEALNVGQDASLENLRPEYLYQKFGYQIRVGDTFFPTTNFSDEDYRNFLKAVVLVLLNGSSRENIRKALRIFTGYPVEVSDTTSGKGSIEKRYVTQFKNGIILIE
ncbi:hypothetical protein EBS02_01130, partial [bacterium]|nr:hypothetical protein [bacterium]